MELVNMINFIYIPAGVCLSLFFINVSLYLQRRESKLGDIYRLPISKVFTTLILCFALSSSAITYNVITFLEIQEAEKITLSTQDIYLYLGADFLSIFLGAIVLFVFLKKISSLKTEKTLPKLFTFVVSGFIISTAPVMLGLMYIFSKIGNA